MLASSPAATVTTTTTASPSRPSRIRGLSYLRNYTQPSRSDTPPLTRSISSPNAQTITSERREAEPAMNENPIPSRAGAAHKSEPNPTIKFIPHVEMRSSRPSLHFTAITKTLKNARGVIRVGRYTERDQNTETEEVLPVGFKSKVVSRRHCEFWCSDGQWYVKDVKSSSGTFLNHVRLSSPGLESRPYPVNDGDVVQLGIDFKGGEEIIFRCVKIRIECNRGWQKALNSYNTTTHKKLLKSVGAGKAKRDSDAASVSNHECSICLNPVTPCQCLFVAPCSHVWHYKCVRNLVHGPSYPNFLCPNCRFVADLEADVEQPEEDLYAELDSVHGEQADGTSGGAEQGMHSTSSSDEVVGIMDQEDTPSQAEPTSTILVENEITSDSSNSAIPQADDTPVTRSQPILVENKTSIQRSNSPRFSPGTPETSRFVQSGVIIPDHLLTPRNNAGPFVLDGADYLAEH